MLGAGLGNPTPSPSLGVTRRLAPARHLQTLLSSCRYKYFQAPNLLLLIHPCSKITDSVKLQRGCLLWRLPGKGFGFHPRFPLAPQIRQATWVLPAP